MCLITNTPEKLIAQEDMTVYKILRVSPFDFDNGYAFSVYFLGFGYKIGELCITEIKKETNLSKLTAFDSVDSEWLNKRYGYPSFYSRGWKGAVERGELTAFGPGFHSFLNPTRLGTNCIPKEERKFECTIPKGSEYILDPTGLVVSNQIIINKRYESVVH